MIRSREGVIAALALASCGARVAGPPPCPGDAYFFVEGTVDGAPIGSGCRTALGAVEASRAPGPGRPDARLTFYALEPWPRAAPFCAFVAVVENVALTAGAEGALTPQRGAATDTGFEPRVYAALRVPLPGSSSCEATTPLVPAADATGTWRVVQAGTFGEVIEVEFRDVDFPPLDGRVMRLGRVRWRVRLPPLVRT